jgi:hypothetical protein
VDTVIARGAVTALADDACLADAPALSGEPQSPQNLLPAGFSELQLKQRIPPSGMQSKLKMLQHCSTTLP